MAKKPKNRQAFREELASSFIDILESEELSWTKGWKTKGTPYNPITGTRYKGMNIIQLFLTAKIRGYNDPRWVTFNQISDPEGKYHKGQDWKLKKGSECVWIEYFYPIKRDDPKIQGWDKYNYEIANGISEPEDYWINVKFYKVFNASCIEGMPELEIELNDDIKVDEIVDKISKNMGVEVLYDSGDKAFYMPSEDKVHLPKPEHFETQYDLNCTSFHELAHATGHPNRLVRDLKGNFGDEKYAYEELVAEMTSCLMSVNVIDEMPKEHLDNHKAYVQNWISILNEKPEMLSSAINDAKESANYMDYMAEVISKEEFLSRASQSAKRSLGFVKEENIEYKISNDDILGKNLNKENGFSINIMPNNTNNVPDNVMRALKDYYYREFGEIALDESMNYSSVPIAYTTTPDERWNIEYTIDLNDLKWHQMIEGAIVDRGIFRDYEEIAEVLNSCSFEDFIRIDEDKLLKEMNLTIDYDGNFKKANLVAIKLEQEFEAYKNDLKNKDVEYIIDRSFETYYRDNIVISAENMQFTEKEQSVLLTTDHLLDRLYDDWMDYEFDEMEGYLNSVVESKDKIMQHHINKCIDKNKEAGYEPEL